MILKGLKIPAWLMSPVFLVLFALFIRMLYLLSLANDPWLFYPTVDEIAYHNSALTIYETGKLPFPFFRPPLWSLIINVLYHIFGPHFIVVRFLNILIGSAVVFSCYRLSIRLFNKNIAYYSSMLLAVTGLFIHINSTGLDTNLFILLVLESTVFLYDYSKKQNKYFLVVSAILIGLSILLRPVALITSIGFALFIFLKLKNNSRIYIPILYLFLSFIPVLPFTISNVLNSEYTILSTNGGINFYLGNNPFADGFSPTHPELGPGWTEDEAAGFASNNSGNRLSASEVSSWYYSRTIDSIVSNPTGYAKLLFKKIALTLGSYDISNNGDLTWYKQNRILLNIFYVFGFYIFIPLGIVGMIIGRRDSRTNSLSLITIISLFLPSILFFTTARFRLPILPFILPFVIIAFKELFIASYSPRTRFRYALVTFTIFLLCFSASFFMGPKPNLAYGEFLQGQLYVKAGLNTKARESFTNTLAMNPKAPLANYSIGKIFYSENNFDSASYYFKNELSIQPRMKSFEYLAQTYRKMNRHVEAATVLLEAFSFYPDKVSFIALAAMEYDEAALLYSENGDWEESVLLFEKAHSLEPSNPYHRFGLACSLWVLGKKQEADDIMNSIALHHPDFEPVEEWLSNGWRPE